MMSAKNRNFALDMPHGINNNNNGIVPPLRAVGSVSHQIWLYVLIVLSAGVMFYLRSTPNIPMEDNLFFSFVKFDVEDVTCDYEPVPISGIDDIVKSLHKMYQSSNGRIPVHFFVMLFMGIVGVETFYVVNSVVFVAVSCLASVFIFSRRGLTPFRMLLTVLVLLYCMPQTASLWFCPAYGINYMWSLGATLLFLLLWRSCRCMRWWQVAVLCPVCYMSGWTHEAFVVPVSCMLIFVYAMRLRDVRSSSAILALAYVAGTVTLLCAPAVWSRADGSVGNYPGLVSWTVNAVMSLLTNLPFDILVVVMVWMWTARRDDFRRFCRDNLQVLAIVFFATGMVLVIVMGFTRGSIALSFFCIALLLRIACRYISIKVPAVAMLCVLSLFVWHQAAIAAEARRHYKHYKEMIADFLASPTGTVAYAPLDIANPLTAPWVEPWAIDIASESLFDLAREMGISFYYRHPWHKPLRVITPSEASVLQSPETFFIPANRVPGTGGFYTVGSIDHLILRADSAEVQGRSYTVRYDFSDGGASLPLRKRLKFRLYGLSDQECLPVGTFTYEGHDYVAVPKEKVYKVAAVDAD